MENADVGGAIIGTIKRRISRAEESPAGEDAALVMQMKQRKIEQAESPLQHHGCNLLTFCDELLYEIFKYLDSWSILAVMNCSPRFESLLLDHRFWHNIDLSNSPLPLGILEDILGRATEKTHTIKICGPPSAQHVAGEFKQFTCTLTSVFPKVATQLQVLELQGVSLDFEYIHIAEFPSSLTRLVLKDCSVKVGDHTQSIFNMIERQLLVLEDLSIEDNNWFEPYYIMALSKLPSLRRLSLKGCQMMCKFVPYGSMAARFGFQKLEVLDLRLTPINNSDLQCFSAVESLCELLLESPPNLKIEVAQVEKTSNGSLVEDKKLTTPQPKPPQLNDDEPSTSRAAMEHLRACAHAKSNDVSTSDPSTDAKIIETNTFNSDNCNERKRACDRDARPNFPLAAKRSKSCPSDDDYDDMDDDDSTDESDTQSANSHNEHNGAPAVPDANADPNAPAPSSPLVVIALPTVSDDRALRPEFPPGPGAVPRGVAANEAPANPNRTPRAYIYVPEGGEEPGEGARPEPNMVSLLEQMALHMRTAVQHWRGNNPSRSRFLQRQDQVIYMNPQAIREPLLVMHSRRHNRAPPRGNLDQVVQHPMFWNMLDPLDPLVGQQTQFSPMLFGYEI
ncbi:uncharacterized protein LOC115620767 isoform X2 [Scaptodrosophila lebanonensis]|uniref:Uncharacterized protein LOC115620767 isoform X2 n=1 Tax=Drosophila lebanonensis TaxID=7225 RepID=A0A6J2SZJ8_DROLE|nr:uncharacterized protein LOC115620767 isoform X2 [Scaptodrosophila lebanonensis]